MYISFADFCLSIIVVVAVVAGIYVVITLRNANKLVKGLGKLLERNADNLTKSLALLPETIKSTGTLAESAREQIDDIGPSVSSIGSSIAQTAASLNEKTVGGMSLVKTAMDVVIIVKDYLESRWGK
jgi:predicted PurR-regulated permease PerM